MDGESSSEKAESTNPCVHCVGLSRFTCARNRIVSKYLSEFPDPQIFNRAGRLEPGPPKSPVRARGGIGDNLTTVRDRVIPVQFSTKYSIYSLLSFISYPQIPNLTNL